MVNRIQRARKECGFQVSDRIRVVYAGADVLAEAIAHHRDYVAGETLALALESGEPQGTVHRVTIDGKPLAFSASVWPLRTAEEGVSTPTGRIEETNDE